MSRAATLDPQRQGERPSPRFTSTRTAPPRRRPSSPKSGQGSQRRPSSARSWVDRRPVLVRRVRVMRIALAIALLAVVARLVDVQVLRSGQYSRQASEELTQAVTIPALRGTITDRNGVVLATSVPTEMVVADDFQIAHPLDEAKALGPLLGLSVTTLEPLLAKHSGYVPLVSHLSTAKAKKVAALAFPGITMLDNSVDVQPNGEIAAPVLGLVNAAGTGAAGIQYQYNSELAGRSGHETLLESPTGIQLPGTPDAEKTPAVAGTGLQLTLDEPLQYTAEQDLAREIVSTRALSGEAVVMDVQTGQILAMANLVSTTPTAGNPANASKPRTNAGSSPVPIGASGPVNEASSNLAVTQLYEPGSVFKLVTFSAALADGIVSPTTSFSVPDQRVLDGSVFHDATPHPTEEMTATQILAESSNIGTSEVAQELGETRLLAQVKALGFGSSTALHFPGASPGIVVGPTQWNPTDYVSLAIGQTDAVSALQVLDAYNAVANGGVMVEPKLVEATVGSDGSVQPTARSSERRVMPSSTAAQLNTMLEQVVSSGTGIAASIPGYMVAGKTGTAQVPADNGQAGYLTAYDATFVGFAPANHPTLSAIVVLDRPHPIYGGSAAAPVFSQIMTYALHRYDVPTTPGMDGKPQAQVPQTLTALVKESA